MQRILIAGAVALVFGGMGVTKVSDMEKDLSRLDDFRRESPRRTVQLELELRHVRTELGDALDELEFVRGEEKVAGELLTQRLQALEASITIAARTLAEQGEQLGEAVEQAPVMSRRIEALEAGVETRYNGLQASLQEAVNSVESTVAGLDLVNSPLADVDVRWQTLVAPTVQLSGETTVGSGVLLESVERADGQGYETLVVTAWHVVRDIIADAGDPDAFIPVSVYDTTGSTTAETATLICHDARLDVALLRLNSTVPVTYGAQLASRADLESRKIFHPIYAVGCPLGNDPIPTGGEIADLEHTVDGSTYWMISAPTYIGNSGGGIFDAGSGRLLGVFSKIYTHGSIRPTVVPHMGLVASFDQFYDWLEDEGHASIVTQDGVTRIVVGPPQPR